MPDSTGDRLAQIQRQARAANKLAREAKALAHETREAHKPEPVFHRAHTLQYANMHLDKPLPAWCNGSRFVRGPIAPIVCKLCDNTCTSYRDCKMRLPQFASST